MAEQPFLAPYAGNLHLDGEQTNAKLFEPTWPPCCPAGPEMLGTRPQLRAAFYTLMNSGPDDDALAEHYGSADEAANRYIQQGLEAAQFHIIEYRDAMRWVARSPELVWDFNRIGYFAELPCNFLRISGDRYHSALLDRQNRPWGRQLDGRERNRHRFGPIYYIRNERIYLVQDIMGPPGGLGRPPPGLQLEYHYRHPYLTSDDPDAVDDCGRIDFEIPDRWLIVAFAGYFAIHDAWPAGGPEMTQKVTNNLEFWKAEVSRRHRRDRSPKRVRKWQHIGPNMLLGHRYDGGFWAGGR